MSLEIKDKNALVSLAIDTYKHKTSTFSTDEVMTSLHNALLEANNGKTYFDARDIRDGKCVGLFAIVEEILRETEQESLENNPLFKNIVEYKNINYGDKNSFFVPDSSYFYVSRVSEGNQGLIRQRISGGKDFMVSVSTYGCKIYDELLRILAKRVDMNEFIDRVHKSFNKLKCELILESFLNIAVTNPDNVYSVTTNVYNENDLLNLCYLIEAKNDGAIPTIVGTKPALRNITLDPLYLAEQGKLDLYNNGYYGKFHGYNCIALPQTLKRNSDSGYIPDNVLFVIGTTTDKPVKFVTEGDPFISTTLNGNTDRNCDLSQDFLITERFGADIVLVGKKNGVYTISQ